MENRRGQKINKHIYTSIKIAKASIGLVFVRKRDTRKHWKEKNASQQISSKR